MNKMVKIENHEISIKEYNGLRVVTFKDIDIVHERAEGTAKRNFNSNLVRFIEGEDYFKVCADEIRTNKLMEISDKAHQDVVFLTEQGYLILVKSFTDDLAWKVQRDLVNTYFRSKEMLKPLTQLEILQQSVEILNQHEKELKKIDNRINKLEYDIPLYGAEADELSNHVKRKGMAVLGGRHSEAYKDTIIRSKVYRDIYDQIKREFGLYTDDGKPKSYKALKRRYIYDAHEVIDTYEVPKYLEEQIRDTNDQIALAV